MLSLYDAGVENFRQKILERTEYECEEGAVRRRLINADMYRDLKELI